MEIISCRAKIDANTKKAYIFFNDFHGALGKYACYLDNDSCMFVVEPFNEFNSKMTALNKKINDMKNNSKSDPSINYYQSLYRSQMSSMFTFIYKGAKEFNLEIPVTFITSLKLSAFEIKSSDGSKIFDLTLIRDSGSMYLINPEDEWQFANGSKQRSSIIQTLKNAM